MDFNELLKNEKGALKDKVELIESLSKVKSFLIQMKNELP